MVIVTLFVTHWCVSLFCQSFFLHRYGAHRMFTMSKGWERFFHLLTWLSQGASYLNPRGYALLHRLHHAYSDTAKDPHSPHFFPGLVSMMWSTKKRYEGLRKRQEYLDARFDGGYPEWELIDKLGANRYASIAWGTAYTLFYFAFATSWWQYLLLPAQYLMGPIHGAIVNWCGHKYGYRSFKVSDQSRNTLPWDLLMLGELFQNNHHRYCTRANFAVQWWELDPTWQVMKVLNLVGIIQIPKVEVPYESADRPEELTWGIPLQQKAAAGGRVPLEGIAASGRD